MYRQGGLLIQPPGSRSDDTAWRYRFPYQYRTPRPASVVAAGLLAPGPVSVDITGTYSILLDNTLWADARGLILAADPAPGQAHLSTGQ